MSSYQSALPPTNQTVFQLAWPLTMKAIMLHGIVVIDTYLVASLGETSLAAMGAASVLSGLLLGVLGAFSLATQIRLAQGFGTGRAVAMKTATFCGLYINLAIALIGILLVFLSGAALLETIAPTSMIAADAKGYLDVFLIAILAEAVALNLSSHFNASGQTRAPFYSYVLTLPVNVVFSIALIHGHLGLPQLGVAGAAAGTAIGSVLRMAYLWMLFRQRFRAHAEAPGWVQGGLRPAMRSHLAFALPIAVTFISNALATSISTTIYARMEVNDFAAMTLIMPWVLVASAIGMSWAQATGIVVAQLIGQRRRGAELDSFLSAAWRGSFVTAGMASLIYLAVCLSASSAYPDLHADTRQTLMLFLPVLLLLPFPKQSNAICGNTLRAAGETVYVMHIFVWSQWLFRVPATALMVLYLDLPAAWVFSLLLFEELVKFPAFHLRLLKGVWHE